MADDSKNWLQVVESDLTMCRQDLSSHRTHLVVLVTGVSTLAVSIVTSLGTQVWSPQSVAAVCVFFTALVLYYSAIVGVTQVYQRRWLDSFDQGLRQVMKSSQPIDPTQLVQMAHYAMGLAMILLGLASLWSMVFAGLLALTFIVLMALSAPLAVLGIYYTLNPRASARLFGDWMGFPKKRNSKKALRRPTPRQWTNNLLASALLGLVFGTYILGYYWALSPNPSALLLAFLITAFLRFSEKALSEYEDFTGCQHKALELSTLRNWILTAEPPNEKIKNAYCGGVKND